MHAYSTEYNGEVHEIGEHLDQARVQRYSAMGTTPPPVHLVRGDGEMIMVNGHHRVHAAARAGRTTMLRLPPRRPRHPPPRAPALTTPARIPGKRRASSSTTHIHTATTTHAPSPQAHALTLQMDSRVLARIIGFLLPPVVATPAARPPSVQASRPESSCPRDGQCLAADRLGALTGHTYALVCATALVTGTDPRCGRGLDKVARPPTLKSTAPTEGGLVPPAAQGSSCRLSVLWKSKVEGSKG
jgi:hypothetical protein